MRAVIVTYIHNYYGLRMIPFSAGYKHLTDEKVIKKAKGWCKSNIKKKYEAGEVIITFYADVMDISTAENIPLIECPPGHCPDCFPRSCTCG